MLFGKLFSSSYFGEVWYYLDYHNRITAKSAGIQY